MLGLGALAFYGLGMSSEVGAVDRAVGWPQYVKDRVRNTMLWFRRAHYSDEFTTLQSDW